MIDETLTDCPLCRSNATFPGGVITNFPSHQIILKLMSLVEKGSQRLDRAKIENILQKTNQEMVVKLRGLGSLQTIYNQLKNIKSTFKKTQIDFNEMFPVLITLSPFPNQTETAIPESTIPSAI